ncbi:hypothetical protein B0T25DRAFT_460566 [Lasiosphaeria hispida]|uniref:NACHT domain-containing protein n=1 Tax=Lasiosphaeria hispida TaxID=260671 RepID=A0AAJ0HA24_9PEZI|nr:hypothetical protein B0T25DRAFT_460566 [Lasiosphaeria hispida]
MPLSVRVSLAAQRTIRDAFRDLERTVSEKDRAGFASTTLDCVIKAAHDVEDQLAARQLLRNMRRLEPLFTGLQYYSKSIELLCNGTPYLPWIWAPIKLILKVASDFVEAFEKIITAYARIAEPLARFKIFDQTYSSNVEIQQTLAIFYSDILKFHKEAYKFVRRSGWSVLFMTSWGRFQRRFDSVIEDLKTHEDLVDKTANAVGISDSRRMREELAVLRRETLERVAKEEEERTAAQYVAIVGWLRMDDSEQAKLFESVMTEPRKYTETCDWILNQDKIVAWMRCSQESAFLVLHGNPGTGKSVLATRIATFLQATGKSLIISHICTYSQVTTTEYDQILRSILLQLVRSDTDLVAYIYEEFILKKKSVTVQAIERLIRETIGAISDNPAQTKYVHIVLDGLDECDKDKQLKIINLLERMVSAALASTSVVCKVLMTTCMPASVAKKLKQKHMVSLSAEKEALRKAITLYSAQRLAQSRSRWHQMGINDVELKDLETRLARKADGMFLWARLVLEYLSTNMFVRKSEVMGAVEMLPRELRTLAHNFFSYGQILTQLISHFDNRSVARLQSILGWIAFAKRPLRRAEMRSALSFLPEEENFHVQELAPNYMFDIVAHEQGLVIASCLLSGLQVFRPSYPEQERPLRVLKGFHGLHVYASEFWVEYLLLTAASEKGLDTSSKFFARSTQLATDLNSLRQVEDPPLDTKTLDSRLVHLESHSEVFRAARSILAERAARIDQDTSVPLPEQLEARLCEVTDLRTLLSNYQHTVQALLQLWKFPRFGVQEFEKFKRDFCSTAFTCRFSGCPLASTGFQSKALRDKHELSHAPRVPCDVPDCRYPGPFPSTQALRNHKLKHHNQGMRNIKIKVPPDLRRKKLVPTALERSGKESGHRGTDQSRFDIASEKPQSIPATDTSLELVAPNLGQADGIRLSEFSLNDDFFSIPNWDRLSHIDDLDISNRLKTLEPHVTATDNDDEGPANVARTEDVHEPVEPEVPTTTTIIPPAKNEVNSSMQLERHSGICIQGCNR